MRYQLVATMAAGLESVTTKELKALGIQTRTENGKVYFEGDDKTIALTNVWLRSADRIKIVVGQFKALTFDALFEGVKALPWDHYLPLDAAFPVEGRAVRSQLHSEPDVQAITKKAIVEKMSAVYHRTTRLPETGATYPLEVSILKDIATLTLDTTGSSLFKRGYRIAKGEAPLKENFAAALIMLTNWHPDMPFVDPTTGSGTIAIEAALIGHNIAPGLQRQFTFENFGFFDQPVLQTVKDEAMDQADFDRELDIQASDINGDMIDMAKLNAQQAGLLHSIQFKQLAVKDFSTSKEDGVIVANPPYGKRLNDQAMVRQLYAEMGQAFAPLTTWSKYILTSDMGFEKAYGSKATKRRKLYNGTIRTDLFQYWGKPNWHHDRA
ncbi:class I SAM-dependent RNA methyltransferase [Lactobacillus paracasei]|uniref:THUMP domain-containing class I SAM-dependent RNA methyltransferase n=3 Tax=Lacticaseibacillus paracasei TaxID=1597 RepID=UPI000D3D311E|nr:class I SAM-dependent RNA methyltransferase [Lacticaseibacillus paracasei]PTS59342.1 RNA methyltransferase [Lactobacillus sp. DS22_6]MBS6629675.1 class I SAM-dependent RNA methyltransferase [Lacticaseibacillus paracasei]MBX4165004.1 class I SAM-dependent RNA methyltransferase [Lacticaseibacillus paracasei]MCZ2751578.1 class I SAM-dependent RNA methyltransferase [Lacticaseibacillus paracasei]MCZ2762089.1 class I SAM-dependent RNA methyltransferase [Lacticaseibacillus paracasei]